MPEPELPAPVPPATPIDPLRPIQVAERLAIVHSEISARFVEIGELLLEAWNGQHWRLLEFETFDAYVERYLDMSVRKARYLADCFRVLINEQHMSRETVAQIGWSKAKELLPVLRDPNTTQETRDRWIQTAQRSTTSELNLAVRQERAPAGQRQHLQAYSNFTVGVFDEEKAIIERAIELGKRESGSDRDATALVNICREYTADAEARHAEALRVATGGGHATEEGAENTGAGATGHGATGHGADTGAE